MVEIAVDAEAPPLALADEIADPHRRPERMGGHVIDEGVLGDVLLERLHVGETGFDTGDPVRASPARIDLVVAAAMAGDYAVELEGDVRCEFVEIPGLAEQGDEVECRPEVVTAERFHPVRPHAALGRFAYLGFRSTVFY